MESPIIPEKQQKDVCGRSKLISSILHPAYLMSLDDVFIVCSEAQELQNNVQAQVAKTATN